jgi:hypothetical protein
LMMEALRSSETLVPTEPYSITSQKTAFFIYLSFFHVLRMAYITIQTGDKIEYLIYRD